MAMWNLMRQLFPLHRSIAGPGLRESLAILQQQVPLELHEIPTGTRVFDWEVPPEWIVRDAYIADPTGHRWVDYRSSNLHVLNHSHAVRAQMAWSELQPHLHSLPDKPAWVPYRTAFFQDTWGFCLADRQLQAMRQSGHGEFEVVIDTEFRDGSLSLGELVLPGSSADECLIHAHTCHPSLANDNLSGVVVATSLAQYLATRPHRWTYRFVFAPATIGAITWLWLRQQELGAIRAGLVLTLLGGPGAFHYKQSRCEGSLVDRAAGQVMKDRGLLDNVLPYRPMGYDERQYGAPAFQLPVGVLSRTPYGQFPEYHTSADDLEFVTPESLQESFACCLEIVQTLEQNERFENLCPHGEPMLGRRGLYRAFGQEDSRGDLQESILWVLNYSDGQHDLLAIAARSGLPFASLYRAAEVLQRYDLLRPRSSDQRATHNTLTVGATHSSPTNGTRFTTDC
jgi:aminopeptidase-like protein